MFLADTYVFGLSLVALAAAAAALLAAAALAAVLAADAGATRDDSDKLDSAQIHKCQPKSFFFAISFYKPRQLKDQY